MLTPGTIGTKLVCRIDGADEQQYQTLNKHLLATSKTLVHTAWQRLQTVQT